MLQKAGLTLLLALGLTIFAGVANANAQGASGQIVYICSENGQADICRIDADGSGAPQKLTNDAEIDLMPRWSPDGSQIAYARRQNNSWDLWLMDADGQNKCMIHDGIGVHPPGIAWHGPLNRIYFSPVFVTGGGGPHYMYWLEANCTLQNGTQVLNAPPTNYLEIDITADGDQLVASWYTQHSGSSGQEICTFDIAPDGNSMSGATCITGNGSPDSYPRFGANTGQIAWVYSNRYLYQTDPDTGVPTRLGGQCNLENTNSEFIDYSPDDQFFVFSSNREGQRKLWIAPRDCSSAWRLTQGDSNDFLADWAASPNQPPTVAAGDPYSVAEGGSTTLYATGNDPDGDPLTYAWDLDNDGSFETPGQNVSFSAAGLDGPSSHIVSVQATDPGGLTAVSETTIEVSNVAPSVSLSGADSANEGDTTSFSYTVIDPGVDTFVLDDESCGAGGALSNSDFDPATGTGGFDCTFPDGPETTTVGVTIFDDDGESDSVSISVRVDNMAPAVEAGSDQIGYEDLEVALDPATFVDPGADTHSATIDWGDGTVEAGTIDPPTGAVSGRHTYAEPGDYVVTVTVTDEDGSTGSDTLNVSVAHGFLNYCVYANAEEVKVDEDATVGCSVRSEAKKVEVKKNAAIAGDVISRDHEVKIDEGAHVDGSIFAWKKVEAKKNTAVGQDITSGGDIKLKENASVGGDAVAAKKVELASGAVVGGAITENAVVEPEPPITQITVSVNASGNDITVEKGQILDLPAGAYEKLEVKEDATLNLSAGEYTFEKIDIKKDARVNLAVDGGSVVFFVEKDVDIHERVTMTGDPDQILFVVAGAKIHLHKEGRYLGTFLAPNAHIELSDDAILNGALYGKKVDVKKRTTVMPMPATKLFLEHVGLAGILGASVDELQVDELQVNDIFIPVVLK